MQNRFQILIVALLMALGFSTPALAANGNVWRVMNPSTFAATEQSILEQFDRVARLDSRLTAEKRAKLASMLSANQGIVEQVPDGIRLNYLTGRRDGQSSVYQGMLKELGRSDRALKFDLGDGVIVYWFTGDKGRSCNNIGVVIAPPVAVADNPPVVKKPCRYVTRTRQAQSSGGLFLQSIYLPGCDCCGPLYVPALWIAPNEGNTITETIMVCDGGQ